MKRLLIILVIIISGLTVNAQQDPMFTHYMFNTMAINPAYAGSRDALTVTGLHRSQWVGFEGAPITQTITLHSPIITKNIGLGLSVLNDKIGPTNTTSFYLDFSYRFKLGKKGKLALGIKGGVNLMSNKLTELETVQSNDPAFMEDASSDWLPNFGFGIYYYTDKYYVGISIPKLLENDFQASNVSGNANLASEEKHYFIISGAIFKISENLKLKPTTFIKVTNGAPIEIDITASFLYKERVWLGTMFRTGDAFGVLAGVHITNQLAIGYSFDASFVNKTLRYNAGSHEIMIRYDFVFTDRKKIRSPRYF